MSELSLESALRVASEGTSYSLPVLKPFPERLEQPKVVLYNDDLITATYRMRPIKKSTTESIEFVSLKYTINADYRQDLMFVLTLDNETLSPKCLTFNSIMHTDSDHNIYTAGIIFSHSDWIEQHFALKISFMEEIGIKCYCNSPLTPDFLKEVASKFYEMIDSSRNKDLYSSN